MPAALITGVSRRRGIAAAVAERLRSDGWSVLTTGWTPYDIENHPGVDEQTESDLQCDLGNPSDRRGFSTPRRVRWGRCRRW